MKAFGVLAAILWLAMLTVTAGAEEGPEAQGQTEPALTKSADRKQTEKSRPATEDANYMIGPQDVLDVSVWKEPDMSRTVPVRPDGKISLPLLNDIQAAGQTPTQLAAAITEMLRKYVTQPRVTVIVVAINSQRVYVLGEVNRPGPIPLAPNMTVLQAIASVGSLTQFANQRKIYVLRDENGKQNRFPFDYKAALQGDTTQNIVLKPGDTIVVP